MLCTFECVGFLIVTLICCCVGSSKVNVVQLADRSMSLEYPFNMAIAMDTVAHTLTSVDHQLQVRRRIVLPDGLVHRMEWRYYQRRLTGDGRTPRKNKPAERLGRKLRVGRTSTRHDNPSALQHGLAIFSGKRLLVGGLTWLG